MIINTFCLRFIFTPKKNRFYSSSRFVSITHHLDMKTAPVKKQEKKIKKNQKRTDEVDV